MVKRVLDLLPAGVMILNKDSHQLIYTNKKCSEMFGLINPECINT